MRIAERAIATLLVAGAALYAAPSLGMTGRWAFWVPPAGRDELKRPVAPDPQEVFLRDVRPVLKARCAPCHEPGGKMYDRLPFDEAKTIRDHKEGVLRRLKGEDREAVVGWLGTDR